MLSIEKKTTSQRKNINLIIMQMNLDLKAKAIGYKINYPAVLNPS